VTGKLVVVFKVKEAYRIEQGILKVGSAGVFAKIYLHK
jgi:hypothetical protein